jgi:hypothetical protein
LSQSFLSLYFSSLLLFIRPDQHNCPQFLKELADFSSKSRFVCEATGRTSGVPGRSTAEHNSISLQCGRLNKFTSMKSDSSPNYATWLCKTNSVFI